MPQMMNKPTHERLPAPDPADRLVSRKLFPQNNDEETYWKTLTLAALLFGIGLGYLLWGSRAVKSPSGAEKSFVDTRQSQETSGLSLAAQVNPSAGFILPASYGDVGPQLISTGAIDEARFLRVLEQAGQPVTEEQLSVLQKGGGDPITINRENARFLLNLFWALGLTNHNSILEEGPMVQFSQGEIGRYASTGGWTLGQKPATELYSSAALVNLTPQQQARLNEVASAVYRPCCDNPTHFPDCNHGMAMLGLLELMASQDATTDQMFGAAKALNAFWFPQQTLEQAAYFNITQEQDFAAVEPRQIVSAEISSGTGFQTVHRWLAENGVLEGTPGGGSGCGV